MIYHYPSLDEPLDQSDLIDGCPILFIQDFHIDGSSSVDVGIGFRRVVIVSQTCDLVNDKLTSANVAEVVDAQEMINQQILKPADIKGPLRSGRIWGLYFLPARVDLGLNEMIVDLR